MKYLKNTTEFYIEEPTVLSLGKFDGIHRGHELLMEHLAAKKEDGLAAVIFTFNIPPRKSVEQVEAKVLTTNEEKMHIFEQIGIDYLVECPFTDEFRQLSPYSKDCTPAPCEMFCGWFRFSFWTQPQRRLSHAERSVGQVWL